MKSGLFVALIATLIVSWGSMAQAGSMNGSMNGSMKLMKTMDSMNNVKVNQSAQNGWKFLDGLSALTTVSDAIAQRCESRGQKSSVGERTHDGLSPRSQP